MDVTITVEQQQEKKEQSLEKKKKKEIASSVVRRRRLRRTMILEKGITRRVEHPIKKVQKTKLSQFW